MAKIVNITNWLIKPVKGGGVCLAGVNADTGTEVVQTTEIVAGGTRDNHLAVETASGTIYRLGAAQPGLWEMALEQRRPEKVAKLRKLGIL